MLETENKELIKTILNNGIEHTCEYITDVLNDNIFLFHELITNCNTSKHKDFYSGAYKVEKIYTTTSLSNIICIDYLWSFDGSNKRNKCTHAVIYLDSFDFRFFQFGIDYESNIEHQEKIKELFTFNKYREYKINKLIN